MRKLILSTFLFVFALNANIALVERLGGLAYS